MQRDIDSLADELVQSMRGMIDPLLRRVGALEAKIADPSFGAQGAQGEPGPQGERGLVGAEGPQGPQGETGLQGPQGEPGAVGKDGIDGVQGEVGPAGPDGAVGPQGDPGIAGKDGRDGVDGKDGEAGRDGRDGRDGADGKDGRDGVDGAPGERGLDALEITILPDLDPRKSYPRGTYVAAMGGLVRASRKTDPIVDQSLPEAGWDVLVDGLHALEVIQLDERSVELRAVKTSGATTSQRCAFPVMIDRGVYRAGNDYLKGDCVSYGGSIWIAQRDTADKPETGDSWRLAVKRGRDGKDGQKGDRGPEGKKGEDGRDLTQMAFDGTRY